MRASEIASYLGSSLQGEDFEVEGVCSIDNPQRHHMAFYKFNTLLSLNADILLLVKPGVATNARSYIPVDNPRLAHARVCAELFCDPKDVLPYGDGTLKTNHPFHGVTIYESATWGRDCYFHPGTVIGHSVMGYERDENNVPIYRPQMGGVKIGNNVTLGCMNTVGRGTYDDTIVGDNVKTCDHVHIAHNCVIGKNVQMAAGTIISGSVTVGDNTWLGTQCTIMDHISIGKNVTIGIGAVVVKDVPDNTVIAGFKAEPLGVMKKLSKLVGGL